MLDDPPRAYPLGLPLDMIPAGQGLWPRKVYFRAKRMFDCVAVLAAAPLVLPVIGTLAFFVRRDGEKAFYCQDRVGRNGKTFKLWKQRSMIPNAEAVLEQYLCENPAARAEWDANQKLRNDPRITRLGRYLRKYSIDELPQLLNVLLGDMSLVGPRPMCPEQQPYYPGTAYFFLRPGLTGPWQISDRNGCPFAERATYDTRYFHTMSFSTDMRIILRTAGVLVRGTGL